MRIRLFGTFDERRHPRVRVLREGLAAHGTVRTDNVPVPIDTAMRVEALRSPLRLLAFVPVVLAAWLRLAVRSFRGPRPDVVVVGHLGHLDVLLARLLHPRATLVLDHLISLADTARDRRLDRRTTLLRLLAALDRLATRTADVVLVDTEENVATVAPADRDKVVVVPVGADRSWFEAPRPPDDGDGVPSLVFFGLYTPLQGAPVIGEALRLLHERGVAVRATMIGDGQDRPAAQQAAGDAPADWIDWVPAAQLPATVAAHDVCLGIFGDGDKARRVVPTKVHQGLAAGCVVVTGDTAPQRRVVPVAELVPPGDATALADRLEALLTDEDRLARSAAAARAFAREHLRPAAVVRPLVAHLGTPEESQGAAPAPSDPALTPRAWLRHDLIFEALDLLPPGSRVLEVGAGQGAMAVRIARRLDYTGVEADPTAAAIARARLDVAGVPHTFHEGRFEELDLATPYDAVCAFEVLEHLEDDEAALAEWRGLLRPGGLLTISVPAWQHKFGPWDTAVGHYRRYGPADLVALLEGAGYVDAHVEVYGFPLANALEFLRNRVAPSPAGHEEEPDMAERTASSGRLLQPDSRVAAVATELATRPFRWLQRHTPDERLATGIVATARRPQ